MLSEEEKKEFAERLKKLKNEHIDLKKSRESQKQEPEDADKFRPIAIVYEFISMLLGVSVAGYFIGKYTDTMPWTMIIFVITGFIYSFYRLFKSVTKSGK